MGKRKGEFDKETAPDEIIRRVTEGRINRKRMRDINAAFKDLDQVKKEKIVEGLQFNKEAKRRIKYTEDKNGEYALYAVESDPISKKPFAVIAVVLIVAIAAFWAYSNFIQEHPMDGLQLDCDEECAYVGEPFVIEAVISPSNVTDRTLQWESNFKDVSIAVDGDKATIVVGPTVSSGEILEITAISEKYDVEQSVSIPIRNEVEVSLDCAGTSVLPGDEIDISFVVQPESLAVEPIWKIDKDYATLSSDGSIAKVVVGHGVKKGDRFTVTASIPKTSIQASLDFIVTSGLVVELSASSKTVDAGDSFQVTATVKPSMPPGSTIVWSVDNTGVTYSTDDMVLNGNMSSNIDHGVSVVITASVKGYDVESKIIITSNNPSRIPVDVTTASDLLSLNGSDKIFNLRNNIDLSGMSWTPFEFKGTFNGNGYTISGMNVTVSSRPDSGICYGGLFSVNTGTVRDLTIADSSIIIKPSTNGQKTTVHAGVVAAINKGMIDDCIVQGVNVIAHNSNLDDRRSESNFNKLCNSWPEGAQMTLNAGGIVGTNEGSISSCAVNSSTIQSKLMNFNYDNDRKCASIYVGGVVGYSTGSVTSCTNTSEVRGEFELKDYNNSGYVADYKPTAYGYAGGIAGWASKAPTGCNSTVNPTTTSSAKAPDFWGGTKGSTSKISWSVGAIAGGTS